MASGWNLWVWLQCIGVASTRVYPARRRLHPIISVLIDQWAGFERGRRNVDVVSDVWPLRSAS